MRSRLAVVLVCVAVLTLGACAPGGGSDNVAPRTLDEVLASLQGLPFREFLDASYKEMLLRNPENVTSLGLSAAFGMRNDKLTDVSPEFILENYALHHGILDLLHTYDRAAQSEVDRLSYDIYGWYLDDWIRGEPYAFHDYPISGLGLMGWSTDASLVALFTDDHPLVTKENLDDYVTRLSLVNGKMIELVEALKYREERGIFPARFTVDMATSRIRQYLGASQSGPVPEAKVRVEGTIIWTSFRDRLAAMQGLSDKERNDAYAAVREGVQKSFIPGYVALLKHLEGIRSKAPEVGGATTLPDGEAYYAFKLRDQTTLDRSAEETREIGLVEVSRIQAEMREKYAALGLAPDQPMLDLRRAANADQPTCDLSSSEGQQAYLAENERVLALANAAIATVCSLTPKYPLEVRAAPPGSGSCYFAPGAIDGSRPGVYYVNMDGGVTDLTSVPVVAYHEGVPGHYFQMTIAAGLDLPLFRRCEAPQAFLEGWALYSEGLAVEMGLYGTALQDLARLDLELQRACRVVMDTGIHSLGWSAAEAAAYYETERGAPAGSQFWSMARYVGFPAQGLSYMIGMLEFVALREKVEAGLGDRFSLIEFHDLVIGNGAMPFPVLERLVDEYIARKLAG
ncbi:MAG: DUF885 domain-containing protein [Candidatus Bipolaricaulota bacterium]|nr:DUF885 domain-containing protein [Candidatus Bipolaricaulota bacterium]